MKGAFNKSEKGRFSYPKRGASRIRKGALILEIKKGTYENEKCTLIAKETGNLSGKRGTCQNKRGTFQRWKEEGAILKINRGTYQSNRGTFYVKGGASYKVKGALFLCKKGHCLVT